MAHFGGGVASAPLASRRPGCTNLTKFPDGQTGACQRNACRHATHPSASGLSLRKKPSLAGSGAGEGRGGVPLPSGQRAVGPLGATTRSPEMV